MSTAEQPALGTPENPDLVLVSTFDYQTAEPGFCGHCLRVQEGRRTRQRLYADIRPAAVAQASTERHHMSTLLCRHFARKQRAGTFVVAAETLMCIYCFEGTLGNLSLPETTVLFLRGESIPGLTEESPTEPQETTDDAPQDEEPPPDYFTLFLHFSYDGAVEIASLVSRDPAQSLTEVLAEACAVGLPPADERGTLIETVRSENDVP